MPCIIIPCFNEARRIKHEYFTPYLTQIESIIFVNDGSADETQYVLTSIAQHIKELGGTAYLVNHSVNQGKGSAVRSGMLEALKVSKSSYFAVMDADRSTPTTEIIRLTAVAKQVQAPIVQGARVALSGKDITRSVFRHYMGRIGATLISVILGLKIYDTQAGAKVFKRKVVFELFRDPFISRWLFDCEVFIRAQNYEYLVFEEPLLEWRHVSVNTSVNWKSYVQSLVDLFIIKMRTKHSEENR